MKIFGTSASKAFRAMWMAEEASIPFDQILVHPKESKNHTDLLSVNPMGKIPALEDDGFTLFESLALTTYIARKHAPHFIPIGIEGEALLLQWTLFAVTEIEPPLIAHLHAIGIPFGTKDGQAAAEQLEKLHKPFECLNESLVDGYLVGKKFTVTDLNVAACLSWARIGRLDLSSYPNLDSWLSTCFQRPAYLKLRSNLVKQQSLFQP